MPGDWIKVESDLYRHPKVLAMSQRLGVTSVTAMGYSICAWCVLDQFGASGIIEKMGEKALDALVECPGFARAMEAVGWLVIHENGDLEFPHYEAHNGPTAKTRAATQKRVQRHRNGSALHLKRDSVTKKENKIYIPPTPKGGEIDEIISELSLPKSLDSDEFRQKFRQWVEIRLGMKRSKKPGPMFQAQLRKLAPLGCVQAIACIEASIAGGYQGIFPERFSAPAPGRGFTDYRRPGHAQPAPMAPPLTAEEIEAREAAQRAAAHAAPLERWQADPEKNKKTVPECEQAEAAT